MRNCLRAASLARVPGGEDFECDIAIELLIVSAVNHTHAAVCELILVVVVPERLADHDGEG